MIDLHSHILPGIDDGANSIEDTVALARQSVEAGVTHMVCTPHIHQGIFENNRQSIQRAFEQAVEAIQHAQLPLKLSYAAEVRLTVDIINWVNQDLVLYIGAYRQKRVLLLELPHSHIPAGTDTLVKWLLQHGVQPVIPHPERNREIISDYPKALWLRNIGCMFQMTAGAITGRFRKEAQETAWKMLKDNLIAYVASDLHSLERRPNDMGQAYQEIASRFGSGRAQTLFVKMPEILTATTRWH